jgi:hypothetical protein
VKTTPGTTNQHYFCLCRPVPQADLLSFQPTLLFLPVIFLLGYFFFVTYWVPRIVLTFKARAWLTRYQKSLPLLVGVTSPEGWPEILLMVVQFAGLVWVVTRLTLVTHSTEQTLISLKWTPPTAVTYAAVGAHPVENFFLFWKTHRETLFFAPAAAELTHLFDHLLGKFGFFTPGKQFPLLNLKLKKTLAEETTRLSGLSDDAEFA